MSLIPRFLTAEQVAEKLGMTTHSTYELLKSLHPPIVAKLGRRVRVNEAELAKWLATGGHAS